ncbi:MAG: hypothetical protein QF437_20845 [Planctomycetota bacterium]|nr:hypothetical protein [Planctomycetota bacterium]
MTLRELLEESVISREMIDRFLDPDAPVWAKFDPELGYLLKDCVLKDGVDECYTLSHYASGGERMMINHADQPCRMNTYGNSFTQCHQVSDGETWQEYLAAHLGEPIRNYGIGGFGVYQAYLRMLREEATVSSAENMMLNIYSDDHYRSIYPWRGIHMRSYYQNMNPKMFHANPWAHVRLNPESGKFEEVVNQYSTPESLYQLCEKEHVYETFKDEFTLNARAAQRGVKDAQTDILQEVADAFGRPTDFSNPDATAKTAQDLLTYCGLASSVFVVEKATAFAEEHGKKLIILLSYASPYTQTACEGNPRFDQWFVDALAEKGHLFVDSLAKHVEDFQSFRCTPEEYIRRYYIGHYNPLGNHFFAFAIEDAVVDWLAPKPRAYAEGEPPL